MRARDAKPDALVIIAYYGDAALIARGARAQRIDLPLIDVSSCFGKATFDPNTRRVNKPHYTHLFVHGGVFNAWDGKTV